MKKFVLMVVVMAIAAPVMATISFITTQPVTPDGSFTVGYTSDASDEPRGLAVRVTLSGGYNIIGVAYQAAEYNANIDHL